MKLNISKEAVGKIVRGGLNIAVGLLVLALPSLTRESVTVVARPASEAKYSDAVQAIMNSAMLDSYKREIVGLLKQDGDSEYYRTVIMTISSDMLDSYKRDVIKELSEK